MAPEARDPADLMSVPTLIHGRTWEEMTPGVTFRTTGRTITEADLISFITLVGANEPLFFDARFAPDHGYSGRLVPGMLTFSYAEGLVIQGGSIHGTGLAFLHADLDIKAPVYVGDTITVLVEVTEQRVASTGNRGVVTTRNTVYNQRGEAVMEYSPVRLTKERTPVDDVTQLTDDDQVALRGYFRHHFQERVRFNKACGVRIAKWDGDEATFELSLRDDLTAHPGVFHGGVVSALIDTAGTGAVVAGHDFTRGSRVTTVSLSVNYLSVAPGEGIVAEARCTRRGRSNHYAEVHVYGAESRKLVAQGLVTCNITGTRDGFDQILAAARRDATTSGTSGSDSPMPNSTGTL